MLHSAPGHCRQISENFFHLSQQHSSATLLTAVGNLRIEVGVGGGEKQEEREN